MLVCPGNPHLWNYALEHDFTVVTTNARDFIRLLNVEVHPGLIVLRESGLTRDEQWDRMQPIIDHIVESTNLHKRRTATSTLPQRGKGMGLSRRSLGTEATAALTQ